MYIIKIGGGQDVNIEGIVADLAQLEQAFIVVHGANALRDQLSAMLGLQKTVIASVSGYSSVYSDKDALDVIMMSYAGVRNKRLVELCQQRGINAVGLSGLDGRLVQGARNKGIRVRENGKTLIKHDLSGKPKRINTDLLNLLLDNGYTPVLTIPIADENGNAINSENDDIVTCLTQALGAEKIVQLIEAPGFLDDPADESTLVPSLSRAELKQREMQVEGRMKRKMLALRRLFEGGAAEVIIADGRVESPIRDALDGKGSVIR